MSSAPHPVDARLIQAVVREVMARLRSQHTARPTSPAAQGSTAAAGMVLDHPLITLETLQQVPAGAKRVQLRAGAVVTPAAADEARLRNLTLERSTHLAATATGASSDAMLIVADADQEQRGAAVAKQLVSRGSQALARSMSEVLDGLQRGEFRRAVILSDLSAPVVCQACRHGTIRAAAAGTLAEVQRIEAAMHPNLWVLDMHRMSLAQAVALADRCSRLSLPGVPI